MMGWQNLTVVILSGLHGGALQKGICYFDDCISHQNCNCWHSFI